MCDLTGVPAVARILRELPSSYRATVHVVTTDSGDQVPLPSTASVEVTWHVVDSVGEICDALVSAVRRHRLPTDPVATYVWLAGEAHASRQVRKYLRRELNWPQSAFYTCGYWQIDAAKWAARYEQVSEQVTSLAAAALERSGSDEGAYLDELDQIYESVGL